MIVALFKHSHFWKESFFPFFWHVDEEKLNQLKNEIRRQHLEEKEFEVHRRALYRYVHLQKRSWAKPIKRVFWILAVLSFFILARHLSAQESHVDLDRIGGSIIVTGLGPSGVGIPRITISNDSVIMISNTGFNVSNFPVTYDTSDRIGRLLGHVTVDNASIAVTGTFWQATQPVSGTFWQATQPVSAASLPLPTGASTSANQSSEITSLANLDVALSTRTKPADQQHAIIDTSLPAGINTLGNVVTYSGTIPAVSLLQPCNPVRRTNCAK